MKKFAFAVIGLSLLSACATGPREPMTAAGPDFLTRNANVKRVVTTPSGHGTTRSGAKRSFRFA